MLPNTGVLEYDINIIKSFCYITIKFCLLTYFLFLDKAILEEIFEQTKLLKLEKKVTILTAESSKKLNVSGSGL